MADRARVYTQYIDYDNEDHITIIIIIVTTECRWIVWRQIQNLSLHQPR